MPNWCHNNLIISAGSSQRIKEFKNKAEGPTQNYNTYDMSNPWPAFDEIRIKALWDSLPCPGMVEVFSFHSLFPVPDEVLRLPYDDNQAKKICNILGIKYLTGGYSWEAENWGVKWGACNPQLDMESNCQLYYCFDTPWGPPVGFLRKVSEDWPDLTFQLDFEEPGAGFCGSLLLINGEGEVQQSEMTFEDQEERE